MRKLLIFLNPLAQLGSKKYSVLFPGVLTTIFYILSEFVATILLKNPDLVGIYIIFLSVALIIYTSFRDGTRGGYTTSLLTVLYYLYITFTRQTDAERSTSLITIATLSILYFILAFIIGWLKEKIDGLIETEADEKKRLQIIIQQLPVGILITDRYGNIVQSNKQLDILIGMKIQLGRSIHRNKYTSALRDIKTEELILTSETPIALALSKRKVTVGKEFVIHRSHNKKTYVQVSASPVINKKNIVIAATTIISDITQQKKANEVKDEFLSIASHELKTPLTTIKTYIQILKKTIKKVDTIAAEKYLEKADHHINKLSDLISDLLDVSKITAGKLQLIKTEYDINEMIDEVVHNFQILTPSHTIIKKGKVKSKLYGDNTRTEQVLTNFLTNAVKYSPNGKKIIVESHEDEKNVTVSVTDYGIGIPKNKQKQVFERFYRVQDTEKTFAGLGIGLYICAEVIKHQGGKIWFVSEHKKGSTFYFSLPKPRSNNTYY